MYRIYLVSCIVLVHGGQAPRIDKDQFCTDPRTMAQHAAYTEWADAYSCTRHRCQPGGRNLAIYTVGCKRVEAPESAIECEEVVEDTNMQFPYCCTRLRCLVVVRGEVWTRVLGQPWEALPAAPWSHMYKMKKPPPVDSLQKTGMPTGPVYELSEPGDRLEPGPVMRGTTDNERDCDKPVSRASATPDIVIALTTKDKKSNNEDMGTPRTHEKKFKYERPSVDSVQHNEISPEYDPYIEKEISEEQVYSTDKSRRRKVIKPHNEVSEEHYLSEAQQNVENVQKEPIFLEVSEEKDKPGSSTGSLQTLVDAIGTRMRDIENVVQRMSEQVVPPEDNIDRARPGDRETKILEPEGLGKRKTTNDYDRLPQSRYLRPATTREPPAFADEPNMHGYFSDPSNNMNRRVNRPKEPPLETYMAPIDTSHRTSAPDFDEKKRKKHTHKKKHSKHGKRKHRRDFSKTIQSDLEKNGLSLENNSGFGKA